MFYTFDYALTDREHIDILISSLKSYHEENDSLLEQAEIIENAFKNNKIEFIQEHIKQPFHVLIGMIITVLMNQKVG